MDFWYIRATNSEFETRDEGRSYASPEDALKIGIRSAIAIVSEEVNRGAPTCAIEVAVEDAQENPVLRVVVSLSVSALHIA